MRIRKSKESRVEDFVNEINTEGLVIIIQRQNFYISDHSSR